MQAEVAQIKTKLENEKKYLTNLKERKTRCKKADDCLTDIITNDSKENAMTSFNELYRKVILALFEKIHSPKEFDNMEIDKGAVKLRRTSNNTWTKLSEISSGQRTALALSIFLALNKSASKAPPIILFDDPVAHTDDLNTLSFLDLLREIVIKDNKQVIFSTANQKLANIFQKKFDFLGDETFKVQELKNFS